MATTFTQGAGTLASPYLISTNEQAAEFFNRMEEGIYARLTKSVDLAGLPHKIGLYQKSTLEGDGFSVSNYGHTASVLTDTGLFFGSNNYSEQSPGYVANTAFLNVIADAATYLHRNKGQVRMINCLVQFADRTASTPKTLQYQGDSPDSDAQAGMDMCVIIAGAYLFISEQQSNLWLKSSSYFLSEKQLSGHNISYAKVVTPSNINTEQYANLTSPYWDIDSANKPRLIRQGSFYLFAGKTLVDNAPVSRDVHLLNVDPLRIYAGQYRNKKIVSNSAGDFAFYTASDAPMTVLVQDHPGYPVYLNTEYALNYLLRPSTPNGFRYRCIKAGNSGGVQPPTSWPTTASITIGTAIFQPEKLAESVCYGPVTPKLVSGPLPTQLVLNKAYLQGEIILPVTPVGYQWRCTQSGLTGLVYPPEPWSTAAVMQVGAAQFTPELITV
jgi:hypothetical protein